jgi:uncharacterized protein (TIGR02246 family)
VAAVAAATSVPAQAAEAAEKAAIERLSSDFAAAWNAHDAKRMAAVWAEDGDLINPFGQNAHGRADIEKFFAAEQAGAMKGTTYTIESTFFRELDPTCAISDWEAVVNGMMDPSGKAMPPFRHHVFSVYVQKGGHWHATAVRAYGFEAVPGTPAK